MYDDRRNDSSYKSKVRSKIDSGLDYLPNKKNGDSAKNKKVVGGNETLYPPMQFEEKKSSGSVNKKTSSSKTTKTTTTTTNSEGDKQSIFQQQSFYAGLGTIAQGIGTIYEGRLLVKEAQEQAANFDRQAQREVEKGLQEIQQSQATWDNNISIYKDSVAKSGFKLDSQSVENNIEHSSKDLTIDMWKINDNALKTAQNLRAQGEALVKSAKRRQKYNNIAGGFQILMGGGQIYAGYNKG